MPGSIHVQEPTVLRLSGLDEQQLKLHLEYHDKRVDHELQRFKNPRYAHWYINRAGGGEAGEQAYREKLQELKDARYKSLLFRDDQGLYTYSGVAGMIRDKFPDAQYTSAVSYPGTGLLAWKSTPKDEPRPYQLRIRDSLLAARHASVEVGTGLGKSFSLELLLKEIALQATVMAPSTSIARQLYKSMREHFGQANVGLYGDGRKDVGKLVTIGIDDSLTRIEPNSPAWEHFRRSQVFVADESHLCPASSLLKVCMGLCAPAPYRFFFSGTQMRNDGLDLVLEGIIGPVVFRMTVQEGVDQGYLARPSFRMVKLACPSLDVPRDPNDVTRRCLYYNPAVNAAAGSIATAMVTSGRPTLILIDEVEQFSHLLPHLKVGAAFAHGPLTKDNVDKVPGPYQESDPEELVDEFNRGHIQVLVGTSCISTGTDVRVNEATIYLVGGQSEIQVRQGACGRSTRGGVHGKVINPWTGVQKTGCAVFDFDVLLRDDLGGDSRRKSVVHRHALERAAIYKDVYPDFDEVHL